MNWLTRFFSTERAFVGDFIETGDELLSLVASNQVVRAEYELFTTAVTKPNADREYEAKKSADALSGYGISVKAEAFIESLVS